MGESLGGDKWYYDDGNNNDDDNKDDNENGDEDNYDNYCNILLAQGVEHWDADTDKVFAALQNS